RSTLFPYTTLFRSPVVGIESSYDSYLGGRDLQTPDYIALQSAGIIAPVMDRDTGAGFMSDVTSVNPALQEALSDASRQYMHDFIADTLLTFGKTFAKKIARRTRVIGMRTAIEAFLSDLHSEQREQDSRIAGYSVEDVTAPRQFERGLVIFKIAVRSLPHFKSIVYELEVGTNVVVLREAA